MLALPWEKLKDYIDQETPTVAPIFGTKSMSFFVGPKAKTIGLRIPFDGTFAVDVRRYRELECRMAVVDGMRTIELSVANRDLFHIAYLLAYAVAELVEDANTPPLLAIQIALERFGLLLIEKQLLSEAQALGLVGELCLLEALLKAYGDVGFGSWLGPIGERHDFRYGSSEFEVKTTISNKRRHRVHGLAQLLASPGKKLFLLSLHFEHAGPNAGRSLPQRVTAVRSLTNSTRPKFENQLAMVGYRDADEAFYQARYQFRSEPKLIPVDLTCPRIAPDIIVRQAAALQNRIENVEYDIDVDGLGESEGSQLYAQCLPGLPRLD